MILIFFIFIIVIVVIITNLTNSTNNNQSNSYYTENKIESYQRQEEDHKSHKLPSLDEDPCKKIGYKRCPICNNINSIKSDVCFMCDYNFLGEKNEE